GDPCRDLDEQQNLADGCRRQHDPIIDCQQGAAGSEVDDARRHVSALVCERTEGLKRARKTFRFRGARMPRNTCDARPLTITGGGGFYQMVTRSFGSSHSESDSETSKV